MRTASIQFGLLLFLLAGMSLACKDNSGGWSLQNAFQKLLSRPSPTEMARMAFDPNDPDRRREGITLLSQQDWGVKEPYLEGYAKILKSDPDPQVRCAAARALGKAGDPRYVPDLAAALSDGTASVRWDAAVALDEALGARRGDARSEQVVGALQKHALQDASVDVRGCCARALRHCRQKEVLKTLIQCLYDEAFAVRYQAHSALVEHVGRDLGYEPEQWAPAIEGAVPPPQATWTRPWWDWFGVTKGEPSAARTGPQRPWWDWMGVTHRPTPATSPTTTPASTQPTQPTTGP